MPLHHHTWLSSVSRKLPHPPPFANMSQFYWTNYQAGGWLDEKWLVTTHKGIKQSVPTQTALNLTCFIYGHEFRDKVLRQWLHRYFGLFDHRERTWKRLHHALIDSYIITGSSAYFLNVFITWWIRKFDWSVFTLKLQHLTQHTRWSSTQVTST